MGYAMGGFGDSGLEETVTGESFVLATDLVEVFDGTSWSTGPSLNIGRRYFGVAVYPCPAGTSEGDCLYAIGGGPADNSQVQQSRSVEVFDGIHWRLLDESFWLTEPRMQLGVEVFDGKIFAAGGLPPSGQLPQNENTCFDGSEG